MALRHPDRLDDFLPPGSNDDKELTLSFQRGEDGAYQAIHDRYAERVYSVCRRMLVQPEDAKEAAQETFLRVYQALGRFNGRYHLGAWITRIATNVCLDHLRARCRKPADDLLLEELEVDPAHAATEDPEDIVIKNAESRRVRKVVASLPPMHRAAIVLRDLEGLSYEEVAIALGITEVQVKALIHRARKSFKRSWMKGAASIFLPARWFQRMKDIDVTTKDHIAHTLAPTAPAASSCSVTLQQCGIYVAEKVAPVATALALGTAAVAAPAPAPAPPRAETARDVAARNLDHGSGGGAGRHVAAAVAERPGHDLEPSAGPTTASGKEVVPSDESREAPPTSEPDPGPSPTPSPTQSSSASGGSGSTSRNPEQPSKPEPSAPFVAAIGFDRRGDVVATEPSQNHVSMNCGQSTLSQRLHTQVTDGDQRYPAHLELEVDGSTRLVLNVWVGNQIVTYISRPSATWTIDDTAELAFRGTYSDTGNAESAGLPGSGTLRGGLGLDCARSSVVTESIIFST